MALIAAGASFRATSALTGIPYGTVRNWGSGRTDGSRHLANFDLQALPAPDYSYLLGIYLGDGHLWVSARTARLQICQDLRYPGIIEEIEQAIQAVMPTSAVAGYDKVGCREIQCYSRWWPTLFPQHGPGRKHERRIELEPWQRAITHAQPRSFIRGLIHSDGCRIVANQVVRGVTYRYARYFFSNRSEDIKRLFCEHLDLIGIEWNRPNGKEIQISRRRSVAALEEFVGPKR